MKGTHRRPSLVVTTGGRGVVAHAGARLLCDLADDLGLSLGLSAAMAPTKRRRRGHDRGKVLVVAEVSDLVDLAGWPEGTRMIARREEPHPGAQLTFTDIDGRRYQVFLTDHPEGDVAFLEALYRGRGRCECAIRDAKDTGLANLPSADFQINQAWLALVLVAGDLLAWMKGLCLDGELAAAEPSGCALRCSTLPACSCARREG
jgi:Transposase DDE domain group 1